MTVLELIATLAVGFIGAFCACLLFVAVGTWIIRAHCDEMRFRRELRLAFRADLDRKAKRQLDEHLFALAIEDHRADRERQAVWN